MYVNLCPQNIKQGLNTEDMPKFVFIYLLMYSMWKISVAYKLQNHLNYVAGNMVVPFGRLLFNIDSVWSSLYFNVLQMMWMYFDTAKSQDSSFESGRKHQVVSRSHQLCYKRFTCEGPWGIWRKEQGPTPQQINTPPPNLSREKTFFSPLFLDLLH